ncbi:MAG: TetR/AcrR family transcriptional regulator [Spongiibacteraceae bacterium]|nr:TetR/AcrR family transcriptional regulator [Spongiibacteraceae bacterium]
MNKSRGRPRKFDSQTALHKAMLVFWQKGLSATSLDDLSLAMDMKRPSIYNAFGNKEAIYRTALAQFCSQLDIGIEKTLYNEPDLRKGLLAFYDQALSVYCSAEPAPGCFMMCTAPAEAMAHPDIRSDIAVLIARVDEKLENRVKQALKEGAIPISSDPKLVAKMIQAVLHSLALRARAGETKPSLKKIARFSVQCFFG